MLLIALGRVAQIIILFATIKVSTSLLPPAEMAKVYLVASIVACYGLLLLNPVGMFMNRRFHAWDAAGKVQYYYRYFWLYLLAVCAVAVVSLALLAEIGWLDIHASTGWLLLLVGGSLLFSTVNQVVIPGLNLLGCRGWFVALTLATAATSLAVATFFVLGIAPKAESWICGLFIGQLIVGIVGWKAFFMRINKSRQLQKPGKKHIGVLIGFAWPISIAVGLGWVQTQSYRFMMESSLGLHELGLFAAGYGISAGIISAIESVFTTYLQPLFYKQVSSENAHQQSKAWSDYAGAMFPPLILSGLFIIATGPELTRFLMGSEYWSASQYIIWGVVAELARVASGIYGMLAHAHMKTWKLLVPSLAGAVLSIILIMSLMPMYGANGVGAALMLSSLAAFGLIYLAMRKEYATRLPRNECIASIFMGAGLILLTEVLRDAIDGNPSFVATLLFLCAVGVIYLLLQYVLLRPTLKRSLKHE